MYTVHVLVLYFMFITPGYSTPSVTLTSCKANTATVTVTNAEEGLIMFFRTDTAHNMITTPGGTIVHACAFDECNVKWNEKFYIVIQKNLLYQTSDDFVIWLVCTSDSDSINAINFEFSSFQVIENLTTKTYKPEVSMSFYKDEIQLDSKDEVKLGDNIQMIIRVTNNANDYFDIAAKSCFASGITLIEDKCSVSDDLFGLFNSSAVGYLSKTFNMFRPTSIAGGPYDVVFTCILEVCLWSCDQKVCPSGVEPSSSSRRKRRNADVRPADGQTNPSIVRGFTLTAVAEGEKIKVRNEEPVSDEFCISVSVIATVLGMFVFVVGLSSVISSISYNYYCNYEKSIVVLKEQKDGDDMSVSNESRLDKPKEQQSLNDVTMETNEESDNDNVDCKIDDKQNEVANNASDKSFKVNDHIKELKQKIEIRTDSQKPYRRKSIPVTGVISSPTHESPNKHM